MDTLLTVDDIVRYLRIKPEIVRRKIRSRQIKAYKIGKVWRIDPNDLKQFLANCLK